MAAAAVDAVPSSERAVPGSVNIPFAPWPATIKSESVDAKAIASKIITDFNQSLEKKDHKAVADLFLENGYWRDHLGATWDLRTAKGRDKIVAFLDGGHHLVKIDLDESSSFVAPQVVPLRSDGSIKGIQTFVIVTTKYGSGRGITRLVEDGGQWKIWTLYTAADELKDYEEPLGPHRANGVQHGAMAGRKNWLDRRLEESNFEHGDPDVLIVGKLWPPLHRLATRSNNVTQGLARRVSQSRHA